MWNRALEAIRAHPSFWNDPEVPVLAQPEVLDNDRVLQSDLYVYECLTEHSPSFFVASLDEATINACFQQDRTRKSPFMRVLAGSIENFQDFSATDRHQALNALNKLILGPERVIMSCDDIDAVGMERRMQQRIQAAKLETSAPSYRGAATANNSLFEAVSLALWGSPSHHLLLRQLVINHMWSDPAEYAAFLGKDYDTYLKAMAKTGTAGDELILRALADRFGLSITVVTGDEVIWCVRYPPKHTQSPRDIYLAVTPGAWFSSVRRQSAISSLKHSLVGTGEAKYSRRRLFVRAVAATSSDR